jgi:hypothetical protein
MTRWSWGAAARSSRPARDSTTQPWRLDCWIRIAVPIYAIPGDHPTVQFSHFQVKLLTWTDSEAEAYLR